MTDKILEVRGLTKTYGGVKKRGAKKADPTLDVLKGIDLDIYRGDVVCLIGPSGCGKSTFLRCLNRLETPSSGSIKFEGVEVDEAHIDPVRQKMGIPRGERYEFCRSVHAEANAIISAQRRDMVGATIYLVGRDARSGELLHDATSCPMCRRMIINAGIDEVVIRRTEEEFDIVPVQKWIDEDDSL